MGAQIEWHDSVERLLEELTDESQIRAKLHYKQYMSYRRRNQFFTLPVVVLSVLSGSGNFISESYEAFTKKYMILGIGAISILVSVISAVSQFLKLAQLEESNRISSLEWGKFYSKIKFQLYLQREDRDMCHDFLMSVFSGYSRLYEMSPPLLSKFIKRVRKKLRKRGEGLNGFILPFYMNGVQRVLKYSGGDEFADNSYDEKIENVPEM